MKKIALIAAIMLTLCFALSACMGDKPNNQHGETTAPVIDNTNYVGDEINGENDEAEVKAPVVDWWKLYSDVTKRNCVTLQVSNPNSFPIGFSFNLVYYKNNEVVKTESMWAVTCVEPNKPGIIYGDIDIPAASEVDRVEIENVEASKFEWKVLDSTFTKGGVDNGKQYFDVEFTDAPRQAEIWVALYNDTNGDKNVQAEEFVQMGLLAPFVGIYEQKGQISAPVPDGTFTDYEIYCVAFTMDSAQ